jgi:hypothetical protein
MATTSLIQRSVFSDSARHLSSGKNPRLQCISEANLSRSYRATSRLVSLMLAIPRLLLISHNSNIGTAEDRTIHLNSEHSNHERALRPESTTRIEKFSTLCKACTKITISSSKLPQSFKAWSTPSSRPTRNYRSATKSALLLDSAVVFLSVLLSGLHLSVVARIRMMMLRSDVLVANV